MPQRPFPEIEQDLRERFPLGGQERPSVASSFRVTRTLAPGAAPLGSDFSPASAAVRSPLCCAPCLPPVGFLGEAVFLFFLSGHWYSAPVSVLKLIGSRSAHIPFQNTKR